MKAAELNGIFGDPKHIAEAIQEHDRSLDRTDWA
jgi:hypothetical protein